ncbi:hypothetical protein Pmani_030297 [Petrolisthes manimaculis]|uniref:Myb/SANT-like DNA-binding domain-containing protein n=1 Tax=Petrolisthes manimaculis TaxID=1843537 RepID=A0AAE1TW36_9EUCA|nr:hypothetical protein Pmani_030297 [Petrolisthes manimaculis]
MPERGRGRRHTPRGRLRKKVKVEPDDPLSYQELQDKVKEVEERNHQLTRLLASRIEAPSLPLPSPQQACKPYRRPTIWTDRSKGTRRVLLRVAYLGVKHEVTDDMVEVQKWTQEVLLHALHQTALVNDPVTCALKRYKSESVKEGWNPLNQIFTVTLHTLIHPSSRNTTAIKQEPQEEWEEDRMTGGEEINYTEIVNHVLPDEVRVLAWAYKESDFPSSSTTRTYKYFFPQAHLNLQVMQEAGDVILGQHDLLRGFNGTGFGHITSLSVSPTCCPFMPIDGSKSRCVHGSGTDSEDGRHIIESQVELDEKTGMVHLKKNKRKVPGVIKSEVTGSDTEYNSEDNNSDNLPVELKGHRHQRKPLMSCSHTQGGDGYDMCVATLTGQDIDVEEVLEVMEELFQAGEGQITPESIFQHRTIHTQTHRSRPPLVSEESLQLCECHLPGPPTWHWDQEVLKTVIKHLQPHWAQHAARVESTRHSLRTLETVLLESGESDIPRAQCEGLLLRENTQLEDTTSLSRPATCLFIQLVGEKFARLSNSNTRLEVFKEVQEEMDACGFTLTLPYIRRLWKNLVMWYCKVKEEGVEEEEEEYFELLEDLLGGGLTTSPVSSPHSSPISSPHQSPITIKAHMSNNSPDSVEYKLCASSTVIIKSQMETQPTGATKYHTQAKFVKQSPASSQSTVSLKTSEASQSDITTKTITSSQSVIAIKTLPTVAMKSKTTFQSIKSVTSSVEPNVNIQIQPSVTIKTMKTNHPKVPVSTQSSQPTVAIKTQLTSQPIISTTTQSTSQPPTVIKNVQPNTIAIKTKKIDLLPQVTMKRSSSFVSPVSIKTRIVTQPRSFETSTSSASFSQVVVKTESTSAVPVATRDRTGAHVHRVAIKSEPQPHTCPTTVRIHSQLKASPTAQSDKQQEPFTIPPAAMSSISQQKPNTTVLHHHGGSMFATQTTSNTAQPKTNSETPEMAQVFLEYLIQQGRHRVGQMEEEMAHVTIREIERQRDRKHRERMDALSLQALREIEQASTSLRNSLLGV